MTKYFKGDETEIKMFNSGNEVLTSISLALDSFLDDVYGCVPLGELLFDENRVPLTNAIRRDVFIHSFKQIFESWVLCGSAESYLTVFKKIFGEDVIVEFTVPAPGKLMIDIEASTVLEALFISRYIEDNEYVFDFVVDDEGDNIVFTSVAGIETQSELEKMLFIMVPNGIYTEITLTLNT